MSDTTADVSAAAPDEREALYVDIANRAQEITGRGIWPSTVKAVLEVAASVSAATPVVIDPHSSHHQPVPGCAYCPQPVYATGANAAATLDEREALSGEGLPERFRFSRKVYGDVADDATRVLLALTDGGHADQPSDYLRWVSIRAAQALAARPAPVVNATDADVWEALFERVAAVADVATRLGAAVDAVVAALGITVADAPAADDEGGRE